MPRSRFSTLIKKYNVKQEPLTFPLRFGPKQLNTTIKKLLKDENVDTSNVNFNFFVNGELLTESLEDFIENKNISQEIEEITYDIEMQPPSLENEVKTQDFITKLSLRSNWLAAASFDVQIFDINALGKPVIFIEMKEDMFVVEWFSFDESTQIGILIAGGSKGQIYMWRCNMIERSAIEISRFQGPKQNISCLAVNEELSLFASGTKDGLLSIWSADKIDNQTQPSNGASIKIPFKLPLLTEMAHNSHLTHIQWLSSPIEPPYNSRYTDSISTKGNLLTCSRDFYLKLWDVSSRQCVLVREENTTNPIKTFAHSSDSGMIVVGSENNRLKVYDFSRPEPQVHNLFGAHENSIVAIKWCPGNPNYFVSGCVHGSVKMWDIRTMSGPLMQISKHSSTPVISIVVSDDGMWLASAYGDNGTSGILRLYRFQA